MKVLKFDNLILRISMFAIAVMACALFAPWWGTPIVVAVSYVVFRLPTRIVCVVTFIAWGIACAIRDSTNDYGPSRVFAKMLSIESVGAAIDSPAARFAVYGIIGLIGFLLALFTGGILKSLFAVLPWPRRFQELKF